MAIAITWLGHSTWWIECGEDRILLDPFMGDNPACNIEPTSLNPTHILISHGHYDHIADAASIANRSKAIVVSNYEIISWLQSKHGVEQGIGMNLGGKSQMSFGTVQFTPALHSSSLPDGSYGGACGGFLIRFGENRNRMAPFYSLYFAGDTALFSDMQLISRHGVDAFIVPIGDLFTMGPEESIDAIQLVKPKVVLPTHYNTWPPIAQDAQQWKESVARKTSCRAIVPAVNEVTVLHP
jgi:L-ascorbate metabolism protein UlaG (beta-lactamase superfamily)